MSNLIPLTKKVKDILGIQMTKQGLRIDKKRLSEMTHFQRPKADSPQEQIKPNKPKSVKEMVTKAIEQKDSDIGLF